MLHGGAALTAALRQDMSAANTLCCKVRDLGRAFDRAGQILPFAPKSCASTVRIYACAARMSALYWHTCAEVLPASQSMMNCAARSRHACLEHLLRYHLVQGVLHSAGRNPFPPTSSKHITAPCNAARTAVHLDAPAECPPQH